MELGKKINLENEGVSTVYLLVGLNFFFKFAPAGMGREPGIFSFSLNGSASDHSARFIGGSG